MINKSRKLSSITNPEANESSKSSSPAADRASSVAVCNKWFHSNEQMFRHRCDIKPKTRITFPWTAAPSTDRASSMSAAELRDFGLLETQPSYQNSKTPIKANSFELETPTP